jgi:hypothetical protein
MSFILFGIVLFCKYIMPTVNTSMNAGSAATSFHTGKKCVPVKVYLTRSVKQESGYRPRVPKVAYDAFTGSSFINGMIDDNSRALTEEGRDEITKKIPFGYTSLDEYEEYIHIINSVSV